MAKRYKDEALTWQDKNRILTDFLKGKAQNQIGIDLKVDHTVIQYHLKKTFPDIVHSWKEETYLRTIYFTNGCFMTVQKTPRTRVPTGTIWAEEGKGDEKNEYPLPDKKENIQLSKGGKYDNLFEADNRISLSYKEIHEIQQKKRSKKLPRFYCDDDKGIISGKDYRNMIARIHKKYPDLKKPQPADMQ